MVLKARIFPGGPGNHLSSGWESSHAARNRIELVLEDTGEIVLFNISRQDITPSWEGQVF